MESLLEMQKEQQRMEKRLDELTRYLNTPAIKNFKEVDEEGYPNPNSDMIMALRKIRHEYNCLETDYKELMQRMESTLFGMHEASKNKERENRNIEMTPLAIVQKIDPNSPAEKCGFEEGDVIIQYGGYKYVEDEKPLNKIGQITQSYLGGGIEVLVARKGKVLQITLRPNVKESSIYCGFFIVPY
ncbi:26S proteasome non-ATPase regulatory subunit, putative [Entamoeba invadens IP1]|uniref:26S proteasome non-ATPase regulatory subunit, putative n=1 Tax=Entamoeba invadens IP1 TaxID=370355 RepID=A0A0A1U959_ENTIV|nr:26S proteasome non-ATPase regulatory subunit, putative [Entamoeba invadens IP1]ELP91434.1 26S proteasome non-ATPase regulatory subunit, putative [Entamoeba invadens IP1]|eukprot:XP_004258205.1 26S proteasome non-ATPase regulatory subunit, putative [Entamoeba invadens IP1]